MDNDAERTTQPLLWKLVGVQMLTLATALGVVAVAIHMLAADHFMALMDEYGIAKDQLEHVFFESLARYFVEAAVVAALAAFVMSAVLTRRILGPVAYLAGMADQIGVGNYTARSDPEASGELRSLAAAFNRMAERLAHTEQLRRTLVANVGHELRTPLTNMRGYLEALRDGVVPSSRDTFELLHSETLRIGRLVEDMLRLGEAEAARRDVTMEPIALAAVIEQQLSLFRVRLEEKQIRTEVDLDAAHTPAPLVREMIEQAVANILDNACQYTPRHGVVAIRAERSPGRVRIVFENSGEPIAPHDLSHVFERFFRVEPSRSRDYGGAGLGLAIVKELIEAHGGRVGADSTSGRTRIWFEVPSGEGQ